MNSNYTYFVILAASIAGPFILSFDKKVAFYRKWKYLVQAIILPALFYIVWDIYFTSKGVWEFNPRYVTGIKLLNLPIEEVLFFFLVPYCCIFIYECIRTYFPSLKNIKTADIILKLLAGILILLAITYNHRYYTCWTFAFLGLFIILVYLLRPFFKSFDAVSFLTSFSIVLLPFLLVNGFLTAIPVVIYNNAENLSIRIYTIPVEDVFYGMLLMMLVICLYEKRLNRAT